MAIIHLIRRMSTENPLWGAPRIQAELALLGHQVAESTVAKYMVKAKKPDPSQRWTTFLRNHMDVAAACDFFVVPTATFKVRYVFVVLSHARRRILHVNVTAHPTAEWVARQLVEAFPGTEPIPRFLVHDGDGSYGTEFTRALTTLGIEPLRIAPRSPWQNCYAERVIGTLCRECTDHVIAFWREPPAPAARGVRRLLQRVEAASIARGQLARAASGRAGGGSRRDASTRRTAPPVLTGSVGAGSEARLDGRDRGGALGVALPGPSEVATVESSAMMAARMRFSGRTGGSLLYSGPRRRADALMHAQPKEHTLQPTVLVGQVNLRLFRDGLAHWHGRRHFLLSAGQAMRHVLIDHMCRKASTNRAGKGAASPLEELVMSYEDRSVDIEALDTAPGRLKEVGPEMALDVEVRFFAGASVDEMAPILGARRNFERRWQMTRTWLHKEIR